MLLLSSKKISYLPDICKAWVVILPPTYCMYTSTIFRENCEVNGAFLLTNLGAKALSLVAGHEERKLLGRREGGLY